MDSVLLIFTDFDAEVYSIDHYLIINYSGKILFRGEDRFDSAIKFLKLLDVTGNKQFILEDMIYKAIKELGNNREYFSIENSNMEIRWQPQEKYLLEL